MVFSIFGPPKIQQNQLIEVDNTARHGTTQSNCSKIHNIRRNAFIILLQTDNTILLYCYFPVFWSHHERLENVSGE